MSSSAGDSRLSEESKPSKRWDLDPSSRRWIHDVFLSFRGEDMCASFTSPLQAIEESQISVIVFSIVCSFAVVSSRVVPVFYCVDPYEVWHQTREFGKNFDQLINRTSMHKGDWREQLEPG